MTGLLASLRWEYPRIRVSFESLHPVVLTLLVHSEGPYKLYLKIHAHWSLHRLTLVHVNTNLPHFPNPKILEIFNLDSFPLFPLVKIWKSWDLFFEPCFFFFLTLPHPYPPIAFALRKGQFLLWERRVSWGTLAFPGPMYPAALTRPSAPRPGRVSVTSTFVRTASFW